MVFQSPTITELPDGRLLAPLYGWFVEDTAPSDEPEYVAAAQRKGVAMPRRTRVIVVASEDRGLNWHYLATVCARVDPQDAAGRPIPHEGPCEPTMALAPNGELVCVMRVGRMTPLYQSRSHDEGRTWNEAEPLHTIGVAPFMRVISHGVLACSYGTKADLWQGEQQQEIRIMFSFDNGRSWELDKPVYVGAVCAYTAFCEVSPGVLLYVYAPHTWSMPGDPEWPGIKGKKSRCGRLARITLRL
jgi:hypothetical protein